MPPPPSIKGSVLAQVVEDVLALLDAGAVARADLGRWLRPEDEALFTERPIASAWYRIESYARLNDLLRDVAGRGDPRYLRELGRRSAVRLIASRRYPQLEYARRAEVADPQDPRARSVAYGRDLRVISSLHRNILNFSRWMVEADPVHPLRYRTVVGEAAAFPDALCWRSAGFVNELAAQHGVADIWSCERRAADVVVFSMDRDA